MVDMLVPVVVWVGSAHRREVAVASHGRVVGGKTGIDVEL